MNIFIRLKQWFGALILDYPRYQAALNKADLSYLALCDRNQTLASSVDGDAYLCQWQWTSDLHAPKYFPVLGLRLMKRALADHPVVRKDTPIRVGSKADISFIIGHRGMQRLPHLLATLQSIAGQSDVAVECIVVEQDMQSRLAGKLPAWVKLVHTPPPSADMPYCRSWSFNVGAKLATADVLVLHDNDMLVPADYSSCILQKVRENHEVVNLKRFIFYLDEKHSVKVFTDALVIDSQAPVSIMQNSEGGGSIAITKNAYRAIGGFDESFIGWGGEDNEFWERAKTLKLWPYANLPLVHLWHAAQPGKAETGNQTLKHYQTLSAIPAYVRIERLHSIMSGEMSGPIGYKTNG